MAIEREEAVELRDIEVESSFYGHLGLISTYFEELGLRALFDRLMPKTRVHKVTHGDAVLAFMLNGLSFCRRQLYLFSKFFSNLPVERLFGKNIAAEDLNEAVMGELLDRVYAFGPTELFQLTINHILRQETVNLTNLHTDTTNFSVWGEYPKASTDPETGEPTFEINIGHPKDGRWDLNRFTLSLISNADGVPLFMKTYSGNVSDHETLKESMVKLQSALRETLSDEKKIFFIADAAFYTSDNIKDFKASWITRVPATLSESAMLLHQDVELVKGEQDERYSFYETSSEYGGVAQKWVLIHSQEMEEKQARTFEKRLEKQMTKGRAALTHLKNFEFACEADARAQAKKWISSYPLLEFAELRVRIEKRRASGRKGRPQKGEELKEVFFVEAELRENAEGLERERRSLGRFILASNDTSLSGERMLEIYKEQGSVERGFRFLKNKSFLVSESYLKKPERIEALAFIMVLCLTIYSLLELKLRRALKDKELTIPDALNKPTSRPTLQWAFSMFGRITEVKMLVSGVIRKVNLTIIQECSPVMTILSALGPRYKKAYSDPGS